MNVIINLLTGPDNFLFKVFVLLLGFLYIAFAFVLYRQERLMATTVEVPSASFFQVLSLAHLFSSIAVVLISFLLL